MTQILRYSVPQSVHINLILRNLSVLSPPPNTTQITMMAPLEQNLTEPAQSLLCAAATAASIGQMEENKLLPILCKLYTAETMVARTIYDGSL